MKCKITVLQSKLNDELVVQYGVEGFAACPVFEVGQVFHTDYAQPDNFCDSAWNAMSRYVFALYQGCENERFFHGGWIKDPGTAICCCNDGLRPVYFKIEPGDN